MNMERNENGFSGYNFTRGVTGRNRGCPGTGDMWQGNGSNGNMNGNSNGNMNGGMNGSSNGNMIGGVTDGGMNNNGNASQDGIKCSERQLAMVYSPHQCWRMLYSPDVALVRGTLFEELDKPLEDCVNG
jgi:hypothetical protein